LARTVTRHGRTLFRLALLLALGAAPLGAALAQDQTPPAQTQPTQTQPTQTQPAPAQPAKPQPAEPAAAAAPTQGHPAPKPAAAAKPAADKAAVPAKAPAAAQPAPAPAATTAGAQPAQPANNNSLGLGAGTGPIDITSDESLEMQQSNKVYIARGNAVAKRGDRTLYADTLMAYYRDIPNSSQTEIWRVIADGHVKITTPTQTVVGDHAVDDLDTKTDVITGQNLKLTTPTDVVTARDSLEWYEDKSVAVARGNAVATRTTPKGFRRIRGDVLVALIVQPPGEAQRISRVDATGHVFVSTPDQTGSGDEGVYNAETGIVTLTHHVTLTRGENTLTGEYGVVDTDKGVSRLLPRPPTAAELTRTRVNGYIVPKQKNPPPGQAAPATGTPDKPAADKPATDKPPAGNGAQPAAASDKAAADAAQNVQPDAAKAR
jgi:lipopolysaccharide export system protein LptA